MHPSISLSLYFLPFHLDGTVQLCCMRWTNIGSIFARGWRLYMAWIVFALLHLLIAAGSTAIVLFAWTTSLLPNRLCKVSVAMFVFDTFPFWHIFYCSAMVWVMYAHRTIHGCTHPMLAWCDYQLEHVSFMYRYVVWIYVVFGVKVSMQSCSMRWMGTINHIFVK